MVVKLYTNKDGNRVPIKFSLSDCFRGGPKMKDSKISHPLNAAEVAASASKSPELPVSKPESPPPEYSSTDSISSDDDETDAENSKIDLNAPACRSLLLAPTKENRKRTVHTLHIDAPSTATITIAPGHEDRQTAGRVIVVDPLQVDFPPPPPEPEPPAVLPADRITKAGRGPSTTFTASDDLKLLLLVSENQSWGQIMLKMGKNVEDCRARLAEIAVPGTSMVEFIAAAAETAGETTTEAESESESEAAETSTAESEEESPSDNPPLKSRKRRSKDRSRRKVRSRERVRPKGRKQKHGSKRSSKVRFEPEFETDTELESGTESEAESEAESQPISRFSKIKKGSSKSRASTSKSKKSSKKSQPGPILRNGSNRQAKDGARRSSLDRTLDAIAKVVRRNAKNNPSLLNSGSSSGILTREELEAAINAVENSENAVESDSECERIESTDDDTSAEETGSAKRRKRGHHSKRGKTSKVSSTKTASGRHRDDKRRARSRSKTRRSEHTKTASSGKSKSSKTSRKSTLKTKKLGRVRGRHRSRSRSRSRRGSSRSSSESEQDHGRPFFQRKHESKMKRKLRKAPGPYREDQMEDDLLDKTQEWAEDINHFF